MIEQNFNELDGDFVKVWSQYLLDGDLNVHAKNIEKLAELGQINAIIEYFRSNPEHVNPIIEQNLNQNTSNHFNVLYAKAMQSRRNELRDVEGKLSNILQAYKHTCRQIDDCDFIPTSNFGQHHEKISKLKQEKAALRAQILDCDFVKRLNDAVEVCYKTWQETNNPVVLETYCEWGLKHQEVMLDANKTSNKTIELARNLIWQAFCRDMKNPSVKFACGNNLMLFSKGNREIKNGQKILKTLVTTNFSNKMKNYQLKGEKGK